MTALILLKDFLETQIEIWRPVAEFQGYEVSTLGQVRSYWRKSGKAVSVSPKSGRKHGTWTYVLSDIPTLLKPLSDKDGYLYVRPSGGNGKYYSRRIHRLQAFAFIPNDRPLIATKINHKNNVHDDNRVPNLEWCTEKENREHAIAIGVWPKGVKHGMTKLTEDDVRAIRRRIASGESNAVIGGSYGITGAAIYRIRKGLVWKEVI